MRARLLALADWGRFHDAALRSARARHGSGLDVSADGHQGGQALHEFQRRHDDMSGAVLERTLQLQHDIAGAVTLEPFVGDRRAEKSYREKLIEKKSGLKNQGGSV
jgi:hypothetical protein